MKKWICVFVILLMGSLSIPCDAWAASHKRKWEENNFNLNLGTTAFDGVYERSYLDAEERQTVSIYDKVIDDSVYLLMINGGFVPEQDILRGWRGNTLYVSTENLECLGIKTIFDTDNRDIILHYLDNTLVLHLNSYTATFNGKSIPIENPVELLDKKIYVPIRFVLEQFGGKVQYVHDYEKTICHRDLENLFKIHMISIEMVNDKQQPHFLPEDRIDKIKELSVARHSQVVDLLKERGQTFTEENKDYDPFAIYYTGKKLGRYYIYELKGFEGLPIFMNQYTGEIYSENPWTPIVSIEPQFPDLCKLF